ncbi:MAG: DUF4982 domain-containing protein [Ruminococcus sp.]|nr:DUF4982 domain-containing protein [Ruminococcus sp.]
MRETRLLCDGWQFAKCPFGTEYKDAQGFAPVDLPHDWLIYNTNDLYETSTGWYKRTLTVPADGRSTALRFDGVYMDSKVYVNGVQAFEWKYGYTPFEADITDYLKEGDNEIAVRVDHHAPNSRWYSGAGIYRKVTLKRYEQSHILPDGVYVNAQTDGKVTVITQTERPENETAEALSIRTILYSLGNGERIEVAEFTDRCNAYDKTALPAEIVREGFKYTQNIQTFFIKEPKLWSVSKPQLYMLKAELFRGNEFIDLYTCEFGIRSAEFDPDKGFLLNGRHLKIHGACEHHDLGALGAAFNKHAMKRKLLKLREMGINAIRTSHNPPAEELLTLCDRMGFLVMDEGFDMWEKSKTEYDYARFFPEWINKDVCAWVRRDRNHPCVIGWSIGNEIYDTHASERGQEVTSMLLNLVRKHDPLGNAVVTHGNNFMQWDLAPRCTDILKVAGYNYAERLYKRDHAAHPDWGIYGSETSSVVQSRGIYHFPLDEAILCDDDEQCSALGNSSPAWAAKNTLACIIPDRDTPYCAGQFIWTGFDYIGEPTPYSTKNSYFGQIDTAGFEKDSFYIFKAEWTDYKTAPFIHVYPYWDFNEGQDIDIRVVSNAPFIRLFFNGVLIGEKALDHKHGTNLILDVKRPYETGTLTAAAYDENGSEIARDEKCSFTDATALTLTADKMTACADGEELFFIMVTANDKNGIAVNNAVNRVDIEVSGEGRLLGLDNGDSTDYEQYKTTSRRMFSGKLLAIIAATKTAGWIKIKATSPGLESAELELMTIACETDEGISANERVSTYQPDYERYKGEIPVRKIELSGERTSFDKEHDTLTFKTVCKPDDATYKDAISYRLTTVSGIDTNIAEIVEQSADGVTIKCKGDGELYLRALCNNGKKTPSPLSVMRLTAEGLGQASFDAYHTIAGGLFTKGDNVTAGIERGLSLKGGLAYAAFENVDFGRFGSNKIIIPIYMLRKTPVKFDIIDGLPENGEVIGTFENTEESAWLKYNDEQEFTLSKKLTGMHTISISSADGFEIKSIRFARPDKEFSEVSSSLYYNIYGDSFTLGKDEITHIGNNVVIDYGEFDFTERQPKKLIITGRSALEINSIHFKFTNDDTALTLCEFTGCEEYTERAFDISGIKGKGEVSFTFLPGTDFDLKSFRFE